MSIQFAENSFYKKQPQVFLNYVINKSLIEMVEFNNIFILMHVYVRADLITLGKGIIMLTQTRGD